MQCADRIPFNRVVRRPGRELFMVGLVAAGVTIGVTPLIVAPVRAQEYRDAAKAPLHWLKFAELVKLRFEEWMSADDVVAARFRSYVRDHQSEDDGPPPRLEVRAWLNPDGSVAKVNFSSLKNARADQDLRTILERGNVGKAPPPEMLQPLRLRFALDIK